jgi:hypothetical protein
MSKNKPNTKQKAFSDEALSKKYEAGQVPIRKIMKGLLTTKPTDDRKKSKEK